MDELRELRVYMLGVGILACLLRIGMIVAEHIDFRSCVRCAENAWLDPGSPWWSFWS